MDHGRWDRGIGVYMQEAMLGETFNIKFFMCACKYALEDFAGCQCSKTYRATCIEGEREGREVKR